MKFLTSLVILALLQYIFSQSFFLFKFPPVIYMLPPTLIHLCFCTVDIRRACVADGHSARSLVPVQSGSGQCSWNQRIHHPQQTLQIL